MQINRAGDCHSAGLETREDTTGDKTAGAVNEGTHSPGKSHPGDTWCRHNDGPQIVGSQISWTDQCSNIPRTCIRTRRVLRHKQESYWLRGMS